jgi:hypothetical protein
MLLSLFLPLLLLAQAPDQESLPILRIEAPPELASARTRLEALNSEGRLSDIARLIGTDSAGLPIQVQLAAESSDVARATPAWIAGFAVGGANTIVVFPSRSPSYPSATLDDVLRHEVAHILIHRAAGRPVPRWFNEGLAMAAEHGWKFRDQTRLLFHLVSGPRLSLAELNRLFESGETDQARAYLLSGAIVRDMLKEHGENSAARILQRMGHGDSFEEAFIAITGVSPLDAESRFWDSQHVWTNWVSILVSDETLWIAVTLLALLAILRRRRKNAEIERKWEEEERRENGGIS